MSKSSTPRSKSTCAPCSRSSTPKHYQPIQTPSNIQRLGQQHQSIITPTQVTLYGMHERSDVKLNDLEPLPKSLFNDPEENEYEPSTQPIQSPANVRRLGRRRQS